MSEELELGEPDSLKGTFVHKIKELEQSLAEAKKEFTEKEVIWLRRNQAIGKERREAEKQLEAMREELERHCEHGFYCATNENEKCDCGLDELLQKEGK